MAAGCAILRRLKGKEPLSSRAKPVVHAAVRHQTSPLLRCLVCYRGSHTAVRCSSVRTLIARELLVCRACPREKRLIYWLFGPDLHNRFQTDMASNYWDSTQARYWTFTKDELLELREGLESTNPTVVTKYPLPEPRLLNIYVQQRKAPQQGQVDLRADLACRNHQARSPDEPSTAAHSYSTSLCPPLLYKGRD